MNFSVLLDDLGDFYIESEESLASIPDLIDSANQSGRAAPFVVADLLTTASAARPDAEVMTLAFAESVLAQKLI